MTESPGKYVEVVRACDEKSGALCRKEGDGHGSKQEEEWLRKMVGQSEG